MSRKTKDSKSGDAIAEQSLAATLRKCIEGDIAIQFPDTSRLGETALEGEVRLINPPIIIKMSRLIRPGFRLAFDFPVERSLIEDDKGLALAMAAALYGYRKYEQEAEGKLPPDITGNGHKKIIEASE